MKKTRFLFSLRSQLLAYFGALTLTLLVVAQGIEVFGLPFSDFRGSYSERMDIAFNHLNLVADARKERLINWLRERRIDVSLLASNTKISNALIELSGSASTGKAANRTHRAALSYLASRLGNLAEIHPSYHEAFIVELASRRTVASSASGHIGRSMAGQPLIDRASIPGYNEIIDTIRNPEDGQLYLAIAKQIIERSPSHGIHDAHSLLVVLIDTKDIGQLLQDNPSTGVSGDTEVILVGDDLRILTSLQHSLPGGAEAKVGEHILSSRSAEAAVSGQEGAREETDYQGKSVLMAYRHLRVSPDFGWGLIVKQDMDVILEPINLAYQKIAFITSIGLLLAIGLTMWLAARLSRPMQALSEVAHQIDEGRMDARVPIGRHDEAGSVSHTFNSMLNRIASWQNELETEVDRRTRQLLRSNLIYATLSVTNHAIAKHSSRDDLLPAICQIAVDIGQFEIACVHQVDPHTRQIHPVAGYQNGQGSRSIEWIQAADNTTRHELIDACLRNDAEIIINDLDDATCDVNCSKLAKQMGIGALAAFPIREAGRIACILTLGARSPGFFDAIELNLVREMCSNISFAFDAQAKDLARQLAERALQQSEERLHTVVSNAPLLLFATDANGLITLSEGKVLEQIGEISGMAIGKPIAEVFRDVPEMLSGAKSALEGVEQSLEVLISGCRLEANLIPFCIDEGKQEGLIGVAFDITRRNEAEKQALSARAFSDRIIETANVMMVGLDKDTRIIMFNHTAERISGYQKREILGRTWFETLVPRARYPQVWDAYCALGSNGQFPEAFEGPILTALGEERIMSWRNAMVTNESNQAMSVCFGIDITDQKTAEAQLHRHAFYDPLTGFPNRALLLDRLEHSLIRSHRGDDGEFALMFMDLDRFKTVNDSLGHSAGDRLLVAVAEKIEACIRPGDTVSRIGGDEFALLLEDIDQPSDALRTAQRIHDALKMPLSVHGQEIYSSASIGIAFGPKNYKHPEDVLRDADTAMYRAKASGKARYQVFDAEMHIQAIDRLRIESDMRRALERSEFIVHYQPIISVERQCVAGFEALVRWMHPEHGLIMPDDFIPVAEETGIINEIGLRVIQVAASQIQAWHKVHTHAPPLYISVNLSVRQFQMEYLAERISEIVSATGIPPECLRLEITESVLMADLDMTTKVISEMASRGFRFYLDDFGTGYSSLSYLHRLPFEALKIDRSFISEIDANSSAKGIVPSIISLAHNLNMKVVAEGVETVSQLERLMNLECDSIQGYFFARPLPADRAEGLITSIGTTNWPAKNQ